MALLSGCITHPLSRLTWAGCGEASVCPGPSCCGFSGVPLGHKKPREGRLAWNTGQAASGSRIGASQATMKVCGQQGAPALPDRAEALLGCRARVSPAWRLSPVSAAQRGQEVRQSPEDTGPFTGDVLGSSHTGSAVTPFLG